MTQKISAITVQHAVQNLRDLAAMIDRMDVGERASAGLSGYQTVLRRLADELLRASLADVEVETVKGELG